MAKIQRFYGIQTCPLLFQYNFADRIRNYKTCSPDIPIHGNKYFATRWIWKNSEEIVALVTSSEVQKAILLAQERYLPWLEFREKSWVPEKKEHVWALMRFQRQANNRLTPILDKTIQYYRFNLSQIK